MENILLLGLSGVHLTDSQELPPPEGPSYLGLKPLEKARWPSSLRHAPPGGAAHKRGPDKDQHHPQEPKTNLLRQEKHHILTQTVVILQIYIPP